MPDNFLDTLRDIRVHPANLYRPLLFKYLHLISRKLPPKSLPEKMESILILAQEKLGDAILLMPFLYALHDRFPSAQIDIACTPLNRSLFQSVPFVRETATFKGDTSTLDALLANRKYTLLYNPKDHPSFTFIQMTRRAKAEVKVCVNHPTHNQFYHIHLQNKNNLHIVEKNATLLTEYGVEFPLPNRIPDVPTKQIIKEQFTEDQNYIALNLSAGSEYRKWSLQKWSSLADSILKMDPEFNIMLFAMPDEHDIVRNLQDQFGNRIQHCKTDTLLEVGEYIQRAELLISPDTAVIHIAAARNIPVVGLYPHDDRNTTLFAPYGVSSKMLISDDLTLRSIQPDDVFEAARKLLG